MPQPIVQPPIAQAKDIAALRRSIQVLEGRSPRLAPVSAAPGAAVTAVTLVQRAAIQPWTFGAAAVDAVLPGGALDAGGLHELKPADPAGQAAMLALALGLAVRRLAGDAGPGGPTGATGTLLWCWSRAAALDHGRLHAPGLAGLGLPPERLLVVEVQRTADVLWAMEEGLRSGAVALVAGLLDSVRPTPARRLALAAAAGRTPALLLTHPRGEGAVATATRWRVGPAPGAPHPLVAAYPGAARLRLVLERCRHGGVASEGFGCTVEWLHDTHRFRVAAGVADRADAPAEPRREPGACPATGSWPDRQYRAG